MDVVEKKVDLVVRDISSDVVKSDLSAEVVKPELSTAVELSDVVKPEQPADDGFKLKGTAFTCTLFALCLSVFIGGLDGTIVVIAMPVIAAQFNALSLISWIFLSFLLTQTAGTPLWGRAADMLGRRNALLIAIATFVAGSIGCALSINFPMLACFRALQGAGGGGLMTVSLTLLADIVPASQRGAYLAPVNSMFALASVVGPVLGGFIVDGVGWPTIFWINLPIGALCAVLLCIYVPHTIGREHMIVRAPAAQGAVASDGAALKAARPAGAAAEEGVQLNVGTVDYAGIVLVLASVTCLCLAVTWGGTTYEWGSGTIIALLVIASLTGALLVWVEGWVAQDPVVPMRLFKSWNFTVSMVVAFFAGFAMFGTYVFLPVFFQTAKGASASASGLSMLPMMLALPVGAMLSGLGLSVFKRLDYKVYPILGFILTAVASGLYSRMDPASQSYELVGNLILGGLSGGLTVMVPMIVAQAAVGKEDVSTATSTLQFMQSIAGLLNIAIMQSYFNQQVATLTPPAVANLQAAYAELAMPSIPAATAAADIDRASVALTYAYSKAATSTFYISIAGALAGLIASCFMRFIPLDMEADAVTAAASQPAAGKEPSPAAVTAPL